ncbi:MAG TPA: hypothetical protein VK731_11230, partial [Candidatus Cybelea sp.]|nr:hypothetical protein [Candidatus Cybelea sp.]
MSMAGSNAAFSISPGDQGANFFMPDGSLWSWGSNTRNLDRQPELLDELHAWVKVFNCSGNSIAQETNGSVWEVLNWRRSNPSPLNVAIQDLVDLTGGIAYGLALRRDGTLVGWEMNRGANGQTNAITEVQTNFLWRAISSSGPICIGVSSDGRLWSWERKGFSPLTFTR